MAKTRDTTRTLNRNAGIVLGALYLLIGVLGFGVTSGLEFAARDGAKLFAAFEVNPLHNVVHLVIGVVLLGAAIQGLEPARIANRVVGGSYLVVAIAGLALVGSDDNVLALNHPDNVLHAFTAIVLLVAGFLADRHVGSPATISDAATRSPRAARPD